MITKKNISRDDIADAINKDFGFSRKECLDIVNEIIDIIIEGIETNGKVKIHNFGTFKLKSKNSRIGRNPKTKEEKEIPKRDVVLFKPSKEFKELLNNNEKNAT